MTKEERFKIDMINEFKQMCEIVEKGGRIIKNKKRMLKALDRESSKDEIINELRDILKTSLDVQTVLNQRLKEERDNRNVILDDIRDEIIELLRSKQNVGMLECLGIIDKYRTGSEEEE